jgi:hypothetical protein
LSEKIKKLSAICKLCQNNASFTFRTVEGDATELIGGAESYMPLCRDCFNVNSKQSNPSNLNLSHNGSESTDNGENHIGSDGFLLNMDAINDNSGKKEDETLPLAVSPDPTLKVTRFNSDEEPLKKLKYDNEDEKNSDLRKLE